MWGRCTDRDNGRSWCPLGLENNLRGTDSFQTQIILIGLLICRLDLCFLLKYKLEFLSKAYIVPFVGLTLNFHTVLSILVIGLVPRTSIWPGKCFFQCSVSCPYPEIFALNLKAADLLHIIIIIPISVMDASSPCIFLHIVRTSSQLFVSVCLL